MNGTHATSLRQGAWYAELLRRCIPLAADMEEAIGAADVAFALQPEADARFSTEDASFAYDIENRKAQGILNAAMLSARKLSAEARESLRKALKISDPGDSARAIIKFVQEYRLQLASLLTTTQLAAVLQGSREVAAKIPTIPMFPSPPPPPSLEPHAALDLVARLKDLPDLKREEEIIKLAPAEQQFVRQNLIAQQNMPAVPPPAFEPPKLPRGDVGKIHFPIIDEAVADLRAKNVIDRAGYDRLSEAARSKAFTVTGVDAQDTLEKIRDAMAQTVEEGVDLKTFREKVLAEVSEGTFLSDWHLETVFRTNVQTAFSDGQMKVLSHPFVKSGFPYAAYEAIADDRVRHNHLALMTLGIQGTNIYRINDPVFQTFRPPWDFCDRCSWIPMTIRFAAELGVAEAQQWLATGIEPTPPAFVPMPSFQPPPGFKRSFNAAALSIRLSLQPFAMFSTDVESEHH